MLKYDVKLDKKQLYIKKYPCFHSTEIDNVHEGNPMFQVI